MPAVLKNRNGQFVRQNGRLWSVPLLSQSIHGLAGTLFAVRLQGIYRIEGVVPHQAMSFRAYGQFPSSYFCLLNQAQGSFCRGEKGGLQAALKHTCPPAPSGVVISNSTKLWAGKSDRWSASTAVEKHQICLVYVTWIATIGTQRLVVSRHWNSRQAGKLQQADMPKIPMPWLQ